MSGPVNVSDTRANLNENIVHAARILGRSKARQLVFEAVYYGKQKWKTVSEIAQSTRLSKVRVLQEGGKLSGNHIVEQGKVHGETAYAKDRTLNLHKKKIVFYALNPRKRTNIPTKQTPHVRGSTTVRITLKPSTPKPQEITVDDCASFSKIRAVAGVNAKLRLSKVPEERIKLAFKRIIGETNDFKDWGGEKNDLFTNKLRLSSSKRSVGVFAFKGRATQGALTPKKMGKNGDQVTRLFAGEADAFFVVYHSKVDQSIHEQMRAHAVARSLGGRRTVYGVIDGDDLNRLHQAYPREFTKQK